MCLSRLARFAHGGLHWAPLVVEEERETETPNQSTSNGRYGTAMFNVELLCVMSCDVMQWEPDISGLPVYSTVNMTRGLNLCKKCGSAGKVMVTRSSPWHPQHSLSPFLPSPLPLPSVCILSVYPLFICRLLDGDMLGVLSEVSHVLCWSAPVTECLRLSLLCDM